MPWEVWLCQVPKALMFGEGEALKLALLCTELSPLDCHKVRNQCLLCSAGCAARPTKCFFVSSLTLNMGKHVFHVPALPQTVASQSPLKTRFGTWPRLFHDQVYILFPGSELLIPRGHSSLRAYKGPVSFWKSSPAEVHAIDPLAAPAQHAAPGTRATALLCSPHGQDKWESYPGLGWRRNLQCSSSWWELPGSVSSWGRSHCFLTAFLGTSGK